MSHPKPLGTGQQEVRGDQFPSLAHSMAPGLAGEPRGVAQGSTRPHHECDAGPPALSLSWLVMATGVHGPLSQDAGGGQLGVVVGSWQWLVLGDIPGVCPNWPLWQERFPLWLWPAPPLLACLGASLSLLPST